jgi:hypothetical protein
MDDFTISEPHHSSPSRAPHCFYCDAIGAWFLCDCPAVREIRAGKRLMPKVRVVKGQTIIEHDQALLPLVEKIGRFKRYEKPVATVSQVGDVTENNSQVSPGQVANVSQLVVRDALRRSRGNEK